MLNAVVCFLLAGPSPSIARDTFGVPLIKAASKEEAFSRFGYAVAEDRLWQMEKSRRIATGSMAEVFGKEFINSDRETLKVSYTRDELLAQFKGLRPETQRLFEAYCQGVNELITEAKSKGTLPAGYAENGFEPRPWVIEDSMAISILLFHQFGRFGAAELRNMALLAYLEGQPKAKDRKLDILDDLLWQEDPKSLATVSGADDRSSGRPTIFPKFTRADTERHLAMLPKMGLFELLPGLRLAERAESRLVAETHGAPFKAGSYAIVVGKERSASGWPLILSGPQMGFTVPSIVHEVSIEAPGLNVVGIDVPGVPGIAVGATPYLAWGLTSGVADTDDVFFYPVESGDQKVDGGKRPFLRTKRTFNVKGQPAEIVERIDTPLGPVVLMGREAAFVRRPASFKSEAQTVEALFDLYAARDADAAERALEHATMNFNAFYATSGGDIGYKYVGRIPVRAPGLDPRFPTPARANFEWAGMVSSKALPWTRNPKGGLLFNWNNRPAPWWPNGDSPVWSRAFRNTELQAQLPSGKLSVSDLERSAWSIARRDERFRWLGTWFKQAARSASNEQIKAITGDYDGWALEGSIGASLFNAWIVALREELFVPTAGNFISPELFELAAGPGVIQAALEGRTKLDYRGGRSTQSISESALKKAIDALSNRRSPDVTKWGFRPQFAFTFPGAEGVPYGKRGTYIQIMQPGPWGVIGRNVLAPGEAESGPFASDQMALARNWFFKPMRPLTP